MFFFNKANTVKRMSLEKWHLFAVLTIVINTTGCFERDVRCNINGVEINDTLIGTNRQDVIHQLGNPSLSALPVKGFEDYSYIINNKRYALVLHYKLVDAEYRVESYKCIKAKPRIEVSKYVIWH